MTKARVFLLVASACLSACIGTASGEMPPGAPPASTAASPAGTRLTVAVVATESEPGLADVRAAIAFWNETLAAAGLDFELAPMARTAAAVPGRTLAEYGDHLSPGSTSPPLPEAVRAIPADVVVVLSDAKFISYSARAPDGRQRLVAIKDARLYPLWLPNVLRNVIAHELGHALGLSHNADPTTLMCGRPASCRPDLFEAATLRFFPLTEADLARLRERFSPRAARAAAVPAAGSP